MNARHSIPLLWSFARWIPILLVLAFGPLVGCFDVGSKACTRDDQCEVGEFCSPKDNRCEAGCNADARCPQGQTCYAGACQPKVCEPGTKEACYTGDASTKGVGTCLEGQKYCVRNGQEWTSCLGDVLPSSEVCDNRDNDCDGTVDEDLDCSCFPGRARLCYTGPADSLPKSAQTSKVCRQGVQYCSLEGKWGPCHGQTLPSVEFCNRNERDDNCDGVPDNIRSLEYGFPCCKEGEQRPCWRGFRQTDANKGTQSCKKIELTNKVEQWVWGPCKIPSLKDTQDCAVEELGGRVFVPNPYDVSCNLTDDDCDGVVNNRADSATELQTNICVPIAGCQGGVRQPSFACTEPCQPGIATCNNGDWSCKGEVNPSTEVCNGKDDDCDGSVDNNIASGFCYDGATGCTKQPDGSYQCVGICKDGLSLCDRGKPICSDQKLPEEESNTAGNCNDGLDNDCDGKKDSADPDCNCKDGDTRSCYTGQSGCTQRQDGTFQCIGACKPGIQICTGGAWGACKDDVVPRKEEICGNATDDNCNDLPDDKEASCQCNPGSRPCYTGPEGTQDVGICKAGTQTCQQDRKWGPCEKQVLPRLEDCSNQTDDNCDGKVNDNCP